MKGHRQKVKEVAERIYKFGVSQITIDLVQDVVEVILEDSSPTPDDVGALCYQTGLLLEVFNPELTADIELLTDLKESLNAWRDDLEYVNRSLGLDPNE